MDSFLTRFKNPLTLIAIVLAQVLGLAIQVQRPSQGIAVTHTADGHKLTMLRYWMVAVMTPPERFSHWTGMHIRNAWWGYVDLRHTRERNQQLQREIVRLRLEQDAFAEDAAQGRRLQALLAFKQSYISSTVTAQVIGTSGSDGSRLVYIDKGALDGLKPEQAVITPDGVVGKLRDVWDHSAQLLLINDPSSGAGVILASTRIRGIIRGTAAGQVEIDNLTADSRIKPGESVVTSGGDQVFPRGLPVGVIESIAPDPQHQPYTAIVIKPNANLARLEEVLVITGTQNTLPPDAQADAAQAQAAAEQSRRAADLIAEKLPSLHDETAPAQPGPTVAGQAPPPNANAPDANGLVGNLPGIPNSGLPKPKPALHPDRYSPGTTPPATDLKPGAPASPASQLAKPESTQEPPPQP